MKWDFSYMGSSGILYGMKQEDIIGYNYIPSWEQVRSYLFFIRIWENFLGEIVNNKKKIINSKSLSLSLTIGTRSIKCSQTKKSQKISQQRSKQTKTKQTKARTNKSKNKRSTHH